MDWWMKPFVDLQAIVERVNEVGRGCWRGMMARVAEGVNLFPLHTVKNLIDNTFKYSCCN
ncbi:unnamed protein product [Prunus armeniaca]